LKVAVGAATDVGRVRERNEDSYLVADPLFAVADGLGGHQGGEVASSVALDTLKDVSTADGDEATIPDRLREGVVRANQVVHTRAEADPNLKGMGTTLTAAVAGTGRFHLAHVGDSRAYLLRDGELTALTEDHTLVRRLVSEGRLTPEEADVHPQRSILTRALGIEGDVEVDQATVEITAGDRILLCSDGLTSMITDRDVHGILASGRAAQPTAEALVTAALEAGGQDNVTVVILDVVETEPAPAPIPAEPGSAAVRARGEPSPPRRRRWPRRLVWAAMVALLLAGGAVGARAYLNGQWFVGVDGGRVALFRGAPVSVLGYDLSTLAERTDIPAARAQGSQVWSGLEEGITAGSEAEARRIISQIRADTAPPLPAPSPSPSA